MNTDLRPILLNTLHFQPNACKGQVVVVTGAGRGIGFQIARAFAMLGANVMIAELSETGRDAERTIQQEGGTACFVQTDVSDVASINRLVQITHDKFGLVTTLINNAIYIAATSVADMQPEVWDKTIAVNLRGTYLTCRAFLPDMTNHKSGTIVNMVSADAMPGLSAYIASKQGITGFSQSLALEVEEAGIRVIPFEPGMVDTPGIRSIADGVAPRLGMKPDQFLSVSLHAGYDGLMPAEHAAVATVYLALRLADEFRGQVVNGYEVLERAGVLTPTSIPVAPVAASPIHQAGSPETLKTLASILVETDDEINKLPVFVRPIARQGFKKKTGLGIADWQRLIEGLTNEVVPLPRNMDEQLERLSGYYRDQPKETARFTKDTEFLQTVTAISMERIKVIDRLRGIYSHRSEG